MRAQAELSALPVVVSRLPTRDCVFKIKIQRAGPVLIHVHIEESELCLEALPLRVLLCRS